MSLNGRRSRLPLPDWARKALRTPAPSEWTLYDDGYDPVVEREIESRFSVANGLLGVRASLEQPTLASHPRSYVAGFFDRLPRALGGRSLIPMPDWLRLYFEIDGEELSFDAGDVFTHSRTLDLRRGLLFSDWCHKLESGHLISFESLRFVSLSERQSGVLIVRLALQKPVSSLLVEATLEPVTDAILLDRAEREATVWRTAESGRKLLISDDARLYLGERLLAPQSGDGSKRSWSFSNAGLEPVTFLRQARFTPDPAGAGQGRSGRVRRSRPQALLEAHSQRWSERWKACDVLISGDRQAQEAVRFAAYHLNSAANPENERISIGARSLTGDGYMGHIFWDTEIFLLPFYTLTWPAAARSLLMYRYHILPGARAKAASMGYRGALFPWESTETGEEATPPFAILPDGQTVPILAGALEHHISADIAYAVWQYWQATGDRGFLRDAGAELVLDTARFWASRAKREEDGLYHIRQVVGPDEYHEGVDDNAYTNVMAQWNLERGIEVASLVKELWPEKWAGLRRDLEISQDEMDLWKDAARTMYVPFDGATGLYEQFAGFFGLEFIDPGAYEPRTAAMDILLGRERTRGSQVIKQADVVMLMALLWDRFTPEQREANFRYYERRCGHGSSLSPPMHALVAAKLNDMSLAQKYFNDTAAIDLSNSMRNSAGGIHIAAQGGLWQSVVFGFAGLSLRPDRICFEPCLPPGWDSLAFPLTWRGNSLRVQMSRDAFTAILEKGEGLLIEVGAARKRLTRGQTWICRFDPGEGRWREAG